MSRRSGQGSLAFAALVLVACAVAALPAGAADPVGMRAAQAVAERWGVSAADVTIEWQDPELLEAAGELVLRGTGAAGAWIVELRTEGVLQRARIRAGVTERVAVAARDLPRAAVLTDADVTWQDVVTWGPPAREPRPDPVGWATRRPLRSGELLAAPAVAAPLWVRTGEEVRVIVARGSVELSLSGRAAGSGGAGDAIQVRAETGKRLTGIITAPGTVRVDAGKDR